MKTHFTLWLKVDPKRKIIFLFITKANIWKIFFTVSEFTGLNLVPELTRKKYILRRSQKRYKRQRSRKIERKFVGLRKGITRIALH